MQYLLMLVAALVAGGTPIMVPTPLSAADTGVRCYEDQVIMWDGNTHSRCVDLDDLTGRLR